MSVSGWKWLVVLLLCQYHESSPSQREDQLHPRQYPGLCASFIWGVQPLRPYPGSQIYPSVLEIFISTPGDSFIRQTLSLTVVGSMIAFIPHRLELRLRQDSEDCYGQGPRKKSPSSQP